MKVSDILIWCARNIDLFHLHSGLLWSLCGSYFVLLPSHISSITVSAWKAFWNCRNTSEENKIEPWHDKTNYVAVHPAKIQISLGICWGVWSESSLSAQWVAKDQSFLHVESEDSDQTGQMPRLIWVFTGRTCHFVCFVMSGLKFLNYSTICFQFLSDYLLSLWNLFELIVR